MANRRAKARRAMGGFAYGLACFAIDFFLFALILVVFAYFHHVVEREEQPIGITSSRYAVNGQASPAPSAAVFPSAVWTLTPTAAPSAAVSTPVPSTSAPSVSASITSAPSTPVPSTPVPRVGDFSALYADMFTTGEVIRSEEDGVVYYQSANVHLTGTRVRANKLVYYIADIYIRDIENLKSALANDKYGLGQREKPVSIAKRNQALIAINGDQYSSRYDGYVIRNGMLYRSQVFRDICVLYWDGTMKTYAKDEMTAVEAIEDGAYQVWSFGPRLLDEEGKPLEKFVTDVPGLNPRTAIGYFAPGHYCFVAVEGRTDDSEGITIPGLAALMSELGCVSAYNLDGGQTSAMVYDGKMVNDVSGGARECSDIIMIVE